MKIRTLIKYFFFKLIFQRKKKYYIYSLILYHTYFILFDIQYKFTSIFLKIAFPFLFIIQYSYLYSIVYFLIIKAKLFFLFKIIIYFFIEIYIVSPISIFSGKYKYGKSNS